MIYTLLLIICSSNGGICTSTSVENLSKDVCTKQAILLKEDRLFSSVRVSCIQTSKVK